MVNSLQFQKSTLGLTLNLNRSFLPFFTHSVSRTSPAPPVHPQSGPRDSVRPLTNPGVSEPTDSTSDSRNSTHPVHLPTATAQLVSQRGGNVSLESEPKVLAAERRAPLRQACAETRVRTTYPRIHTGADTLSNHGLRACRRPRATIWVSPTMLSQEAEQLRNRKPVSQA